MWVLWCLSPEWVHFTGPELSTVGLPTSLGSCLVECFSATKINSHHTAIQKINWSFQQQFGSQILLIMGKEMPLLQAVSSYPQSKTDKPVIVSVKLKFIPLESS
ncbi:hypothetical protein PVK06_044423 [Gossypium arboreum]|uniref:Uncharacterized protein n=1 Tax=Gossypium arboreum TaxID=29729 RepID=A0ABR0MTM4_GOSAR|nr:hypothetical protein PVK06_044423 [Gossypium arboreum]